MTKSKKVLIVEDEKFVLDLSTRIVSGLCLEALTAEDSETAMEVLNREDVGLMFLDFNLKDGSTGGLVARTAHGLGVPFIFTSSDEDAYELVKRYNPIMHLQKPYNLYDFETQIKKFYSL